MLRGFYAAVSGMLTEQRVHDAVTNNISNMETPGFKQSQVMSRAFPEMLISFMDGQRSSPIGSMNTGVLAEENVPVFSQGALQQTHRPFDFAIVSNIQVPGVSFDAGGKGITPNGQRINQPQAFFTVQDANGNTAYTRDGQFTVNATGQLVTQNGDSVLDTNNQPVVLTDPTTKLPITRVHIGAQGQLYNAATNLPVLDQNGQPVSLLISKVNNPQNLVSIGNGKFQLSAGQNAGPIAANDQVSVRQGYIESSNVNAAQSATDLIESQNLYEADQKVVQIYDASMDKTVNDVGKV